MFHDSLLPSRSTDQQRAFRENQASRSGPALDAPGSRGKQACAHPGGGMLFLPQNTSVPVTAVSARCGHCSAYIKLDDVILHSRTHRTKVQTCGSVTVQANADLKGLNIECRDLVLYGRASGDFLCRGVCKIKTDQHISGSISARRLVVEKKTTVLVTGVIQVENIWIQGSLEGTLTADETVTIHRHAKFLGDITARRLIIEEGGAHQGSFTRLT